MAENITMCVPTSTFFYERYYVEYNDCMFVAAMFHVTAFLKFPSFDFCDSFKSFFFVSHKKRVQSAFL